MPSEEFQRIEALFHAALALPQSQRVPFLEDACGGDRESLEELRSLLAHTEKPYGGISTTSRSRRARPRDRTGCAN